MFVTYPRKELEIWQQVSLGNIEDSINLLVLSMGRFYTHPSLAGKQFYLPGYDRLIQHISQIICSEHRVAGNKNGVNVFVFSEFYGGGGHSRIAEEVIKICGNSVIIVTDLFSNYRSGAASVQTIRDRLNDVEIHLLTDESIYRKTMSLIYIFQNLKPRSVSVFTHHPDPIPYLASGSLSDNVKLVFYHHADSRPTFGATMRRYVHVDLTNNMHRTCSLNITNNAVNLPMGVHDLGPKVFASQPSLDRFTVVCAGSEVKFTFDGPFCYPDIICDLLSTTNAHIIHIGVVIDGWLERIYGKMNDKGIDTNRFVYMPPVDSLWDTLKKLDAHLYLGSFPVLGGRGAIEAQGCGYPTLFFNGNPAPDGQYWDLFSSPSLGWSNSKELAYKCTNAILNFSELSRLSREHFLATQSFNVFRAIVEDLYN
jgi:hypothetical protein